MIPTTLDSGIGIIYDFKFQSRNRETYDSNGRAGSTLLCQHLSFNLVIEKLMIPTNFYSLMIITNKMFQSRNRETYDSNKQQKDCQLMLL